MNAFIQTLIMYTPLHQLIQRIVIDMQHRLRTMDRPTLITIVYYAEAAHKIYTTRCSAIAERPRCRVRYSFRQK